jgi:hypothetical protein
MNNRETTASPVAGTSNGRHQHTRNPEGEKGKREHQRGTDNRR